MNYFDELPGEIREMIWKWKRLMVIDDMLKKPRNRLDVMIAEDIALERSGHYWFCKNRWGKFVLIDQYVRALQAWGRINAANSMILLSP